MSDSNCSKEGRSRGKGWKRGSMGGHTRMEPLKRLDDAQPPLPFACSHPDVCGGQEWGDCGVQSKQALEVSVA